MAGDRRYQGRNPNHPITGKYHGFDRRAVRCFIWMHDRVARKPGRECAFARTREGFEEFMGQMGPIPDSIKRPSVGRKDHARGYVHGNIRWEPHSYNAWKERRDEADAGIFAAVGVALPQSKWTRDGEDWDLG